MINPPRATHREPPNMDITNEPRATSHELSSIAIIDYGMGNLRSVQKGIERVGFSATVTRDRQCIEVPADASLTATTTTYGIEFTSAIARDNVFAMQYHPEKSQAIGLRILENFGRLVAGK